MLWVGHGHIMTVLCCKKAEGVCSKPAGVMEKDGWRPKMATVVHESTVAAVTVAVK